MVSLDVQVTVLTVLIACKRKQKNLIWCCYPHWKYRSVSQAFIVSSDDNFFHVQKRLLIKKHISWLDIIANLLLSAISACTPRSTRVGLWGSEQLFFNQWEKRFHFLLAYKKRALWPSHYFLMLFYKRCVLSINSHSRAILLVQSFQTFLTLQKVMWCLQVNCRK